MKSLLERITARPLFFIGLIIATIAFLLVIWWLPSQSSKQNVKQTIPNSPANQEIVPTTAPVVTPPAQITSEVSATLPTDPAIAAEVLDRLEDEQMRLKEREAELTKQLATSNKLLALKEKQIESMNQLEPQ